MMLSIQLFKLCRLATVVAAMALPPGLLLDIGAHSVETLPACGLASSGCAFTIRNIAYQKYEPFPGTIDQGLDSITMAFDVTNDANGINTACSFVNGKWDGQWMDYGTKWYTCGNRTVEDDTGTKYVVATIAQFDWDTWNLAINQTWVCGDTYNTQSSVAANVSVLLAPACTDMSNTAYSFQQCSAPDTTADTFPIT